MAAGDAEVAPSQRLEMVKGHVKAGASCLDSHACPLAASGFIRAHGMQAMNDMIQQEKQEEIRERRLSA